MSVTTEKPAGATALRPFHVEIPHTEVDDMRRRIAATRWPDRDIHCIHVRSPQPDVSEELRAAFRSVR